MHNIVDLSEARARRVRARTGFAYSPGPSRKVHRALYPEPRVYTLLVAGFVAWGVIGALWIIGRAAWTIWFGR